MSFQSEELAKKPGVSLRRPISTLNLPTSKDAHAHAHADAPAHTHLPSRLLRGGADEEEGGAVHRLLSVPCCYLRS